MILVEDTAYETATAVMQLTDYVDCLIPRGGPSLIQSIRDNATVPVIIDGDGNCHVYVDASADLDEAAKIVVNAKTQRRACATRRSRSSCTPRSPTRSFRASPTCCTSTVSSWSATTRAASARPHIEPAADGDFGREFLDLKMSVAVVEDLDAAIAHVNRYGTGHTEAILTRDLESARRFTNEVDAAAVIVNASTRFTDGEEFGFGAEIGISTQKLHARGPMGLRELTTYKYVVWGDGQIRG